MPGLPITMDQEIMSEMKPSPSLTTLGRHSDEDWIEFFSAYSHIVLIANSDEQSFEEIAAAYPDTALFVFFNRINRVLKAPFKGNSLLVTRSNQAGSELVYRDLLGQMVALLPGEGFTGAMNLRAVEFEHLMTPEEFAPTPAGSLDLASYFTNFYPYAHTASSGFALAVWLCEKVKGRTIVLNGFSGQRGSKWKLFHIHDWSFEQSVLHLLAANGRLDIGKPAFNPYRALSQHFPDIDPLDVSFAAVQVLSLRLENTSRHVDKLISITMPLRVIYNAIRGLKRKSKKERILAKRRKQEAGTK